MFSLGPINYKSIWESFLEKREDQNFLQSWYWGETQEKLGKKIFRLGICSGSFPCDPDVTIGVPLQKASKGAILPGQLQGFALLIKEPARRGSYLACPAGPLLNWENKELFPFFVKEIKKIARNEKVSFIRIRPQLEESRALNREGGPALLFKKHGFIPAPMHMHAETTWQLELKKPPVLQGSLPAAGEAGTPGVEENHLLQQMTKNHRYEIRKARKKGVKIVASKNLKDIEILYKMQLETAKRHKFVPFSKKRLKAEFEAFLENDNIIFFKALLSGKPIATALFIYYGKEAVYHYSATTEEGRKTSAAYLILWEAVKEAQKREMQRFNFWGIAPEGKKHHRFTQLNHFKKGFGGREVNYLHAQDLPIKPTYWLTFAFETLRRKLRKL